MAFFKNLWTFLTETIFLKDERNYRNGLIRWGVRQYKLLFYTARGLDEHDTLVRSAALTFYTLMSIVPIAALVFAVVKGFGLADGLMQNLYSLFPHNREVVDYLITFADKALAAAQGGVVAFVGIVMLFWAVVRVFGSVEEAFNNIWEVKVSRSFTRQFTDYIAVVVITPILWVVGSTAGRYAGHLLGIDSFGALYTLLSGAVSLLVIWAMFSFIYVVVPNTRVRLGSAVMAGIVAGTLFLAFQWGYVWLQRYMTSYNAIYGSFAALPLFLIWVQWSWQILLFGGSTKCIPMTGVTLPLVSYGGSSLLSTMIIFGMIQGMYIMQASPEKRRNIDDKRRKDHETKNRQKHTAKEPGAQGSQQRRRKPAAGGKNSTKTQK